MFYAVSLVIIVIGFSLATRRFDLTGKRALFLFVFIAGLAFAIPNSGVFFVGDQDDALGVRGLARMAGLMLFGYLSGLALAKVRSGRRQ